MAKQSSVNLDITNNADGFDISGGTTVRKLGITGGDVTIAGSGSAVVTFPTTSTTIAGLGITQSFSALQSFSAGISASGATFSGNISAPNIVTSVNGATGSVTTYAGTTGNIQFRYGSGVTATSYFSLAQGELDEITDMFTISGPTTGSYAYGNQHAIGLRISRAPGGLGLDEGGGLALNVLGIGDDGVALYGSSLQILTPTADLGSNIYFYPGNNLASIMTRYGVESVMSHAFAAGMYSNNLTAGNTFAGPITGVTATFTGLLSASKGISAAGATFSGNVAMTSTSSHTGLASFAGGLSASSGVTFGTNISVNSISVGRGKGNVTSNTALGTGVLSVLTPDEDYFIGTFNTGLGSQALNNLTTGQRNTAVGTNALFTATTSSYNTAVGAVALYTNTTGSYNTAIGQESVRYNTTGVENVGIGYQTLLNLTTANYNTAVGAGAGRARGSGSAFLSMLSATGGIFIGHQARGSASGQTNEIVIGRDAVGLGSNTTVLGATSAVSATIYGLVNAPSGISAAGSTFSGNVNLQDNTLSRIELLDYCERFVDLGDFASKLNQISIDLSTAQVFRTKLTTACTGLSVTNTPDNANANTVGFTLLFVGDGTSRTMTWNIGSTAAAWAGGVAPTYTSTLNKIDVYSFLSRDGGSTWLGFVGGQNF